jgi:hypothetical protein
LTVAIDHSLRKSPLRLELPDNPAGAVGVDAGSNPGGKVGGNSGGKATNPPSAPGKAEWVGGK